MSDQPTPSPSDSVDVLDPQGVLGSVPKDQLQTAIQKFGYKVASPADVQAFEQKKHYESPSQQLLTGAEATASAATLGLSRELGNATYTTPEDQAERARLNQTARRTGTGIGIVGPVAASVLSGGASAPLALGDLANPLAAVSKAATGIGEAVAPAAGKGVLSKIASEGVKSAVTGGAEGAAYGAGQAIDEHALGDPDAIGEKLLAHIGYGALLGGGINSATHLGAIGLGSGYRKIKGAFKPEVQEAAQRDAIKSAADVEAEKLSPPQSLLDVQERVKNASYQGITPGELPARQALISARDAVPDLENPVTALQLESLGDPRARDYYKAFLETQSDEANALKTYEALQKRELTHKLSSEVRNISPNQALTSDPVKSGESLVESFVKQYDKEKKELAPVFQHFDELGTIPVEKISAIPKSLETAVPGIGRWVKTGENGLEIAPYSAKMGLSRDVYGAVSDLVDASNEKSLTLGDIRNIRNAIGDRIKITSAPREAAQLGALKKSLMDYMEEAVTELSPDTGMREAFKRYAINEEKRGIIEKIFGGNISDRASFAKQIKPEDVLDGLFRNTVSVQAAKDILGKESFGQALGNYINTKIANVTDASKNGFSSNKFATWLKSKAPELNEAFAENPEALKRLHAMTDIMRILPDSPSINPSGTAKTLNIMETISKLGGILKPISTAKEMVGEGLQRFTATAEQNRLKEIMNQMMAGKSVEQAEKASVERMKHYSILNYLSSAQKQLTQKIASGAKSVLSVSEKALPASSIMLNHKEPEERKKLDKRVSAIKDLSSNPEKYAQVMTDAIGNVANYIPNISTGISAASTRAVGYLKSQLPQEAQAYPIPTQFKPSSVQLAKFNTALSMVEKPLSIFEHIKHGTLTVDHIKAVATVYPKLYSDMKVALLGHLADHMTQAKHIPYAQRINVSLFIGQPLDGTMTPQAMQAAQMSIPVKPQDQQQQQPSKSSMSALGKLPGLVQTPLQARAQQKMSA